jgi:isovaleryl-CoA dehydrogenase
MAMTEPDAGTDVLGMKTTAVAAEDGFILNGIKQWITNGPIGRYFLVYARTGEGRRDISLFLVEAGIEGFSAASCGEKMGMRSSPTGILTFQDCHLPADACVGRLHEGLRPMLRNLGVERLGLAAQSIGIAGTCLSVMKDYARSRFAFGHPIAEFGQVQSMIATSYAKYKAMKGMMAQTVSAFLEHSPEASIDADATKLFCAGAGEEISRMAIQVLGANGYSAAYPVERLHRDAVLLSIGGGTNEALQKNMTRLLTR